MLAEQLWQKIFVHNIRPCLAFDSNMVICEANAVAIEDLGIQLHHSTIQEFFPNQSIQLKQYIQSTDSVTPLQISSFQHVEVQIRNSDKYIEMEVFTLQKDGANIVVLIGLHVYSTTQSMLKILQLGSLSSGLFHAIRNPLTVIQGRIELLQMTTDNTTWLKNLNLMLEQCTRIGKLLDSTQNITVRGFQTSQFQLASVLSGILEENKLYVPILGMTNVRLENDQERVKVAFDIMVSTILQHSSLISVKIVENFEKISVFLETNISPEMQKFFQEIKQSSNVQDVITHASSKNRHISSLKIIFASCAMNINLVGNDQVVIHLPAHKKQSKDKNKRHILIVDDDQMLREGLLALLGMDGHHIVTVNSGEEAIKVWNDDFDVVLLDVHLPKMSGLDVIDVVRGSHPQWLSKVILISGMGQFKEDIEFPEDISFLAKPFPKAELNRMIANVVVAQQNHR